MRYLLVSGLFLLAAVAAAANPSNVRADEGRFEAGVATVDITPPQGFRMSGYFYERLNTGTHDPLQAKAIVLRQGDVRGALVFCDLIGIPASISGPARKKAAEATGIPASNILIAATHSHTGPLYFGELRNFFRKQAIEKHGSDPHEKEDYGQQLVDKLAQAITDAHKHLAPVSVKSSIVEQQGLSFNRRFHMKDGSVRFNPGYRNPDIIRPAGPIDPTVGTIGFWNESGAPVALLSVFALHLDTVGGTEYSADYPHYLERELRKELGKELVSLFGAGTCGDINHIDVTQASQRKGQEMAEHIGTTLAKSIVAGLPKAKPADKLSLAVKSSTVMCPLQEYSAEETLKARANMIKIGTRDLSFLEQVETSKIVSLAAMPKGKLPCEVQVFRLSDDLAIVGLPGEVFVELGLAIKTRSPFDQTLVVELSNDVPAYIPTRKAFAEGSYETVNSRLTPGSGEMLVEEAVKLLESLR